MTQPTQETQKTAERLATTPAPPARHPGVHYVTDPSDGRDVVSVPDAARIMNCSVRTVYNWARWGWVQVRFTPAGRMRIVVESLTQQPEEDR